MNADSASTAGAAGQKAAYRRVLLKLSGEALMGNDSYGINRQTIEQMCQQVADVNRLGVELAIVIGRICKQVPARRVAEVVFGYTIANDVTARDWQREDDQWFRAKGCDTFCPLGPWINTHLAPAEAGHLAIETRVGEDVRQRGNTSQMLRGIPELVTYISSFATLLPGDVILTGTPAGVGPMVDGDVVSVEIDGLGVLSNPVTAA